MRPQSALRRLRSVGWPCIMAGTALHLTAMTPAHAQSAPAPVATAESGSTRVATSGAMEAGNSGSGSSINGQDSLQVLLQTVTVEAARIVTRAQAIEAKKKAPNIIEVQPLSEMRKLPDVNLAEALQRVPGVSLETDSGEGRFVEIRGIDPDLNATDYSGVPLPASNASSPFGGSRAVALDTFPMGIVSGVQVVKTNEPDMDAESLGGTVDLLPRTGAEHRGRPFLDLDLGGGYEPLRGTPVIHAAATAGGSINADARTMSAVLTMVYHDDQRGIDDVEESYSDQQNAGVPDKLLSNLQLRWYKYHRRRYGAAANFDAKLDEATSLYLRLLYSGYLEQANKHFLILDGLDSGTPCSPQPECVEIPGNPAEFSSPATDLQQRTTDSLERIQNSLAILGGHSTLPGFRLDYRASYVLGTDTFSHGYNSRWDDPNDVGVAYDNSSNANFPTFRTLDGTNPADPSNYSLTEIDGSQSYDHDREWGGAFDLTLPLDDGATDQIKLGVAMRGRHKTHLEHDPVWQPNVALGLAPYVGGAPQVYYDDHYDIGPPISLPGVRQLIGDGSLTTYSDDAATDASVDTDDDESVYAGYGQYTATFGRLGLLTGVRVEKTSATYRGNAYNADDDIDTPASARSSYTNVFPTLQLRDQLAPDLFGRLAYSTAIARPGFNQITPGANVSVSGASVTVGNPNLKPTTGQSLDLTLGYYPGQGRIAEMDVFGKKFNNFILLSQQLVPSYDFPGLIGTPTVVDSYSNGPAHVYGMEVQVRQQFLSLPAPLDGFGFDTNVTVVHSHAQIHPGISGPLPSTAELTSNLALFYQRDPIEVRLAADYVGQNLFGFGPDLTNAYDDYSSPRLTLDLGSSYSISRSVQVYFDAKNLLDTPLKFTEGTSESRPIQREFYDMTLLAGVRASFD